ncbi:PGF-CTERM sorting domain-containing protein [Natrinema caseinilyticum]|uniref:PGF-CTERM sorting domain-containing protein n=1 Tax=Natrinema caseinilyticum TaxID=2961570 RepID=UPI0020C248BE|nr:PGF-CTERM sorting domain-containing protein [Natrinema caseinilyticum]
MSRLHRLSERLPGDSRVVLALGLGLVVIGGLVASGAAGAAAGTLDPAQTNQSDRVSEEAYREPAPEEGDPYFEAAADDGSWISYENPRDEYRSPYLGDGSGKICVTLVNENGDPVVGTSVPNTSVTIPTGGATTWHSDANPMTVEFPVTDHYEFPLDGDEFGTSPDVAQGDGYMDSHCIEFHGNPVGSTIEYGEAELDGKYADRIDVVGYIQQEPAGDGWDSDIDPVADAESYAEAGGGWTTTQNSTHGGAVVVLQLDAPADERTIPVDSNSSDDGTDGIDSNEPKDGTGNTADGGPTDGDGRDEMPGFGPLAAGVAISIAVIARYRR